MKNTLRLILGDQLNIQHHWFKEINPKNTYVFMEVMPESEYVTHHIQKIVGFFLAMRDFAKTLQNKGHQIIYFQLDDKNNLQSFEKNILQIIENQSITTFQYLYPDEYRLDVLFLEITQNLQKKGIKVDVFDTEHFLTPRNFLKDLFKDKKTYLLETFYRKIRKEYNILMNGNEPLTGKWNYDAENRKKYDGKYPIPIPDLPHNDATQILKMIQNKGIKTIGNLKNPTQFSWCINREQALCYLDFFVKKCLIHFGTYEDAMVENEPFLFHSRLSFALNIKLLSPLEVVNTAISYWEKHQDKISFPQIEGFVRQIIGWREYMRGVYWANMPFYAEKNYFEYKNNLPNWFWTGKTKMNCLQNTIQQSLDYAFAHHIQRLMITGNFALLAGINPDEVDKWYLGIYIDAIEWVEITNTRGMSQFADGGLIATKPYVSSANYIDKMSDYCKKCQYDNKKKYGQNACPFNSLYWNFYAQNQEKLSKNSRIGMAYITWNKMQEEEKNKILAQASFYLKNIENL
jgi:deoxyribodipyrimidine photolyase-related protein